MSKVVVDGAEEDSPLALMSDEALRAEALAYAEAMKDPSLVYGAWCTRLAAYLARVQAAQLEERSSVAFQKELWDGETVAATGKGSVSVDAAIADPDFRAWVAKRSLEPVPSKPEAATAHLQELHAELLKRLTACTGSRCSRGSVPRSSRGSARDARTQAAISGAVLSA